MKLLSTNNIKNIFRIVTIIYIFLFMAILINDLVLYHSGQLFKNLLYISNIIILIIYLFILLSLFRHKKRLIYFIFIDLLISLFQMIYHYVASDAIFYKFWIEIVVDSTFIMELLIILFLNTKEVKEYIDNSV